MLYTPLLPEAAAGTLEPRHVVVPLRMMCPHAELILGSATVLDAEARTLTVTTDAGDQQIGYERLVISAGAVARTLPIPGLADHGLGFKDLADAIALRNHVLRRLDLASAETDPERGPPPPHASSSSEPATRASRRSPRCPTSFAATMRYYPELRRGPAALGARRRGAGDPLGDPEPPRRVRGPRARAARRRHPRLDHARRRRAGRRDPLRRRPDRVAHGRLDRRRPREPVGLHARPSARRDRPRARRTRRSWWRGTRASGRSATAPASRTPRRRITPTRRPASTRCARPAAWRRTSRAIRRPYRYRMLGQVATLGRYKGIAEVFGLRAARISGLVRRPDVPPVPAPSHHEKAARRHGLDRVALLPPGHRRARNARPSAGARRAAAALTGDICQSRVQKPLNFLGKAADMCVHADAPAEAPRPHARRLCSARRAAHGAARDLRRASTSTSRAESTSGRSRSAPSWRRSPRSH